MWQTQVPFLFRQALNFLPIICAICDDYPYLCTIMEKFELHILGSGSALPTTRHFPTSQVVNLRDKLFMIDCGEGAQLQFRKSRLKFSRLNRIFISHLHGDHCFGLLGLISTLNLLGRTADLHIHSPKGVTTIPLRHRMPCCGFLFAEKPRPNHILRDMIDFYQVPVYELNRIKNGADYVTPEGEVIPNARLTRPSAAPRRYAYCSDTIYLPSITEQIKGVDLLFHEATFAEDAAPRAKETFHTTASQAARIARDAEVKKLLIGHFSARYDDEQVLLDEARAVFPDTQLAKETLCISV